MIDYLEVRAFETREVVGIVDIFKSYIWHSEWYGAGDFEIYAQANENNLNLLQEDNYITRPDLKDIGIIEKIEIADDLQNGKMITASGRLAKSMLDRRLIYNLSGTVNKATVLRGKVEAAARSLVNSNMIASSVAERNVAYLQLGVLSNISATIVDEDGNAAEKQVSYQNLLEYSDELLQEYELSAKIILDDDTKKLQYVVLQGTDRSASNTVGNEPVVFSKEFDNLLSSEYMHSKENAKNFALVGGAGEGLERFYATVTPTATGIHRRELFVDAASLAKTYKDDSDTEQAYTNAEYTAMLKQQGLQSLADYKVEETFSGELLLSEAQYMLNEDFFLGDLVTVQENSINKYIDVRITETTEVQDDNGYTVEVVYS